MKSSTFSILRVLCALLLFSLGSCNRKNDLLIEQAKIDAELQRALAEQKSYEDRFHSLGAHVFSARETVTARLKAATQIADRLDAEVKRLETKINAYESFIRMRQSEVDSYKASFLP